MVGWRWVKRSLLARHLDPKARFFTVLEKRGAPLDESLLVSGLVLPSGSWNWNLLRELLQPTALPHFMNVLTPNSSSGTDRCIWPQGKHNAFSIKSSYNLLVKDLWMRRTQFGQNSGVYQFKSELNTFFGLLTKIGWSHMLADITWQVWKRRNALLFAGSDLSNDWSLHFITNFQPPENIDDNPRLTTVQWTAAPAADWCKLNSDGAVHIPSSHGSIGGLIRNSNGDWIVGYYKSVGISTPLEAEL
ncbi:hypothetical protein F3Y22_tig00110410pilonHSYRG00086 [Hibiscus syriacus]|uniref:RNase H type-1 domain-containing protein n=1 Tax=Hibiscus syriacus TaxID=106335 RepID=A0A6A3ARL2_HIBSY|nr:hypothetical protein F3Y22_tig00110410pilonHSYRG00086 [Hibiscus syriacus]